MTEFDPKPLKPGDVLAHYRIESKIGEGAMGVVYRAHDTSLDRTVGLKVLKPEVSKDVRFVHRFLREARAAARVSHPNLAHIYFVGEQDGQHFFAMEFIEGQDLQARVEESGPLDLDTALNVLAQVARGLAAAHAVGVVHRDVKPSNILVQPDGVARVTDFGLARSLDADLNATQADTILGTPTYMSPEQCRSQPADKRADIYALGLTGWFLLTGRLPYEAKSLGQLIDDQLNTPLPALTAEQPDLPEALDEVLGRMCAKAPDDRFADMGEALAAIERCRPRPILPGTLVARGVAAAIDMIPTAGITTLVDLLMRMVFGVAAAGVSWWENLTVALLFTGYHVVSEIRWGTTLGKWLLQLEVVTRTGAKPRARVVLPRFFLRYPFVVIAVLSLGSTAPWVGTMATIVQFAVIVVSIGTYALWRQRSLSDLLTRTRVVVRLETQAPLRRFINQRSGRQ